MEGAYEVLPGAIGSVFTIVDVWFGDLFESDDGLPGMSLEGLSTSYVHTLHSMYDLFRWVLLRL